MPLNGSSGPFLLWNGSMESLPKGWKGSHGLEESAGPDKPTGVLLPEDIKTSSQQQQAARLSASAQRLYDHRSHT